MFFEVTRTGEVLSRLTTDTTLIQSIVGLSLSVALRSSVMLTGALIMLAITSPRLTAIIMLGVPMVALPILVVARRVRRLSRDSQDRIADTSAIAGEVLAQEGLYSRLAALQLRHEQTEEALDQAVAGAS
jgi:ATP-binding cassette subfamily B protein